MFAVNNKHVYTNQIKVFIYLPNLLYIIIIVCILSKHYQNETRERYSHNGNHD